MPRPAHVLATLLVMTPMATSAAVYKCVDADGNVTFKQTRCPGASQATTPLSPGSSNSAPRRGNEEEIEELRESLEEYYETVACENAKQRMRTWYDRHYAVRFSSNRHSRYAKKMAQSARRDALKSCDSPLEVRRLERELKKR